MSAPTAPKKRLAPAKQPPMRFSNVPRYGQSQAAREFEDVLERKIEELSRQLTEERLGARQNKVALARLQRDLARARTHDKQPKEQLAKEVEQERLRRVEAECRLHEMTRESQSCQSRLEALQHEFNKMEGVVGEMLQYKGKIEQLKQEKASLAVTYDNNLTKFKSHITHLERENMLLLNDCKKLQCQMSSQGDGRDRSAVLLERLKMLEGENSALVLENEQQRGQYEKCLDEIANQVVQALLAQKMLREECVKLQGRVHDLEAHNQNLAAHIRRHTPGDPTQGGRLGGGAAAERVEGSIESLASMFSEQMCGSLPSVAQLSSPPPWLQERLAGDRHSITSYTGSVSSTPDLDLHPDTQTNTFQCRTQIETEFPATPSSPKSTHVSFMERQCDTRRSSSTSSLTSSSAAAARPRTRSTSSLSRARGLQLFSPQPGPANTQPQHSPSQTTSTTEHASPDQAKLKLNNHQQVSCTTATQNSVPSNSTNPANCSVSPQGPEAQNKNGSKLPVHPASAKTKGESQIRRNSLKAEYSIRMGCQSVQPKSSQSSVSARTQSLKPPATKSKLPSVSTQSRSASTGSARSVSSRIPTGGRQTPNMTKAPSRENVNSKSRESVNSKSKESVNSKSRESVNSKSKESVNSKSKESVNLKSRETLNAKGLSTEIAHSKSSSDSSKAQKTKSAVTKIATSSNSKLVPPKSPNLRYSGIRTTLKSESTSKTVSTSQPVSSAASPQGVTQVSGINSVSLKMRRVYAINPRLATPSTDSSKVEERPAPATHSGDKPTQHTTHSQYPIMGLNTLNHTSPKNETAQTVYANLISKPSVISSTTVANKEASSVNSGHTDSANRGQYFYDYSDEDSDLNSSNNRPLSRGYSVASTISLDELLDQTLEGMDTPLDSDFKSDHFLFNVTLDENGKTADSVRELVLSHKKGKEISDADRVQKIMGVEKVGGGQGEGGRGERVARPVSAGGEAETRLQGQPDIVRDTQECEQRKRQKSLTMAHIPATALPGYRAKRPKSLILGAKEKKFLYCEYGSSSSSDMSEEEWSYQYSYAKNVKEQEIQSKVAKSLKAGQAKVIESPSDGTKKIDVTTVKALNEANEKQSSKLPKSNSIKRPSKIPPPIANKPHKKTVVQEASIGRPKSVEICVNTALADVSNKTFDSIISKLSRKDISHSDSDKCLDITEVHSSLKLNNSETALPSTYDEVKVERSGSKDDGYSTMSSDVQPEIMEKYSDVLESSTNSNDNIRTSNLSLSSQNSFSSEDRQSLHGSLGRVRAMKMKFEVDNARSPETESLSPKSPPMSPLKLQHMSPKRARETCRYQPTGSKEAVKNQPVTTAQSKLPVAPANSVMSKAGAVNMKSAIPTPNLVTLKSTRVSGIPRKEKTECKSMLPTKSDQISKVGEGVDVPVTAVSAVSAGRAAGEGVGTTPAASTGWDMATTPAASTGWDMLQHSHLSSPHITLTSHSADSDPQTSTPTHLLDQFSQLAYFPPTVDKLSLFPDPVCDSNSSLSSRGSDLTSLHISEDNILSDIPEERDGYESSLGHRSECNSATSVAGLGSIKKSPRQAAHHQPHSQTFIHTYQFKTALKYYWSSMQGLVRAASDREYERQKQARLEADYEELYGGCLNIETLNERSCSESDLYTRGDKPEVVLLPGLRGWGSMECLTVDEMAVEERVQTFLKQDVIDQISRNVESADKDEANFSSFVDLLIQRGHVLDTAAPVPPGPHSSQEPSPGQGSEGEGSKMAVSSVSCEGGEAGPGGGDTQPEPALSPTPGIVATEQKRFNSQFYSLCNTGSNRSISDKTDTQPAEPANTGANTHSCHAGDTQCQKCEQEKNLNEFDHISRQIETLSKTVNDLHASLSSLHSENSGSGCESNEGEGVGLGAGYGGGGDVDGYQWVEDELFLSPYGGQLVLGGSPFSSTGPGSADWHNDYTASLEGPSGHNEGEPGGQEAMHDQPVPDIPFECHTDSKQPNNKHNSSLTSALAGSIDKEGNFDTQSFISKRLELEEKRLKSMSNKTVSGESCVSAVGVNVRQYRGVPPPAARQPSPRDQLREEQAASHNQLNDALTVQHKGEEACRVSAGGLGEQYGSQESLDDNIGVDNVMCHRLIGAKAGQNAAGPAIQPTRPALDFSNSQFVRYSEPEKQAVAAFDFLNEMSSSRASDQSSEQKLSHGQQHQHYRVEESRALTEASSSRSNYTSTSAQSKTSAVKRNRRKLRPKARKGQKLANNGGRNVGKFSSTSADESNGEDFFSDDDNEFLAADDNKTRPSGKVMTYI